MELKFKINPYYSPEKCGLETYKEFDTYEEYEFDLFVIWRKLDDNTLWWDTDSGCSCPSPFDPMDNGHDLKPITKDTYHNFIKELEEHSSVSKEEFMLTSREVKQFLNI